MAKTKTEESDKRTPIKLRPIIRKHAGKITEPWNIMENLLADCEVFAPIKHAHIKLYWQKDWKADADNIAVGAQVCKASELDRNQVEEWGGVTPDIFIKLAETHWPAFKEIDRERFIFHELCHIKVAMDSNGKQKLDAKDRPLWRIGKHPITTFPAEIERYGIDAVLGANDKMLEVIRFSDRPMEKVFDEAEKSGMTVSAEVVLTADSWRNYLLAHLGCSARVSKALETAGLKTLGELTNFQAKHGDFWIKDIKGLGATGSEELTNRLESFWTEHPEYCQAQSEEK